MDQGTYHGVQSTGDGQDDGNEVQSHGDGHVQLDGGHHPFGQGHQVGELLHFIAYQGDIRCVYGDVAAYTTHHIAFLISLQMYGGLFGKRSLHQGEEEPCQPFNCEVGDMCGIILGYGFHIRGKVLLLGQLRNVSLFRFLRLAVNFFRMVVQRVLHKHDDIKCLTMLP